MQVDPNGASSFNNNQMASQWGSLMDFLGDDSNTSFPNINQSPSDVKKENEDTEASLMDQKTEIDSKTKYTTGGFKTKFTLG